MEISSALDDMWETPARNRVVYGGRASGKTWNVAQAAINYAREYKVKILATRQFQNKITESVYTVIKSQISALGLDAEFDITNNKIVHKEKGSEFIFYGLARNIDEIKSLEGVDICWIEEAHNLTKEQWEILEPTVRKDGSEFWIVFNPRLRTDFVYKNFVINTPPNTIVKKLNYTENQFLSSTMLQLIANKKDEDEEEYRHIYLGEPRGDSHNSLIDYKTVDRAMHRVGDESGSYVFGVDVARYGDDASVICKRKGLQVKEIETREKQSTTETAGWVINDFKNEQADGIIVDTIGVGAGVYDNIVNQGYYAVDGNFGSAADDKDKFINKRAECYWRLKDSLQRGLALPNDDELMEELVSITFKYTETGKIQITPKDKIKEELGRSPDKADALALTFFTYIHKEEADSEHYYNEEIEIPNLI